MVIVLVHSTRIPSISIDFLRLPTNLFQILTRKICDNIYTHLSVVKYPHLTLTALFFNTTFFTPVLKRPFNMHDFPRVKNSKKLSSVFNGEFLERLKNLYSSGDFPTANEKNPLSSPDTFQSFLDSLYDKDWIVFLKVGCIHEQ